MSYYARGELMQMKQAREAYPTGYADSDLPFYPELDDQEFEHFCTELLNLHPQVLCLRKAQAATRRMVKADRLLAATAQKGVDIRAVAEQGEVWFLQCKHVQEFGPALVSEALDLAEKGFPQADQFVLVTTCGLSEESQKRINERPKWLWWGPSYLTTVVSNLDSREGGINLVHRFFGAAIAKKLFPCSNQPLLTWQEFFAADLSPERTQFHHRIPFVSQGQALSSLEAFAHSGAGRALIFSARGGQGKSRLLLELAQRLENQLQGPRVRFLNLSRHGLAGEQSDFLAREEQDLLLVVDDAHRLEAAMENVARATAGVKSIRLLVATRPQALEALQSQLSNNGYAEKMDEPFPLPPWKPEDIHKLAVIVLTAEHRLHAPRLAALADRCPLLVVLGGALINSGAWPGNMKDQEVFRERVLKSFKEDFLNRQPEGGRKRLNRVINFLSFVSPAPKTDDLINRAAEILDCSPLEIGEDLETLQAAGLVVENREGLRLYPDLFADAVLLDTCLDQAGQPSYLHRTILSKLPAYDFPALMRNLAQADWEARLKTSEKSSLFEPVWQEFVRRFQDGMWVPNWEIARSWILAPHLEGGPKTRPDDRADLLGQWSSFAVYLPEKTLDLARLVIESTSESSSSASLTPESQEEIRSSACAALPRLLKPIVIWHPQHAQKALDILWSLDTDEPKGDSQNDSNAIAVIAEAASFAVEKPLSTSEMVMDWLEKKLRDSLTTERLHRQPWILSALLKPFFERTVEHTWSTGRTLHISSPPVDVDITRPLRQKALTLVESFLCGTDAMLCHAVVPLVERAVRPLAGRFGSNLSENDRQAWPRDRLEVIGVIEKAAEAHRELPGLLMQLRGTLRSRCEYDPDEIIRKDCQRVLSAMQDTFALRVVRVLTSFAHHEFTLKLGPSFAADLKSAEMQWAEFGRSVAGEVVDRFKTARQVCEFLRIQVRDLGALKLSVLGGAILEPIAQISPAWCAQLLEELLKTPDQALDGFLWPVLREAARNAPEAYQAAVGFLPSQGRPQQLSALVSFLGWKHLHAGGLTQLERVCALASAERTEEAVVAGIASTAGLFFAADPQFAIEVLSRLKPTGERAACEIVAALGLLSEKHAAVLDPRNVAQCLANLGDLFFAERGSDNDNLEKVARAFPRQVYEHVREFYRRAEAKLAQERGWRLVESLSLGPIEDGEYVDREIQTLWQEAVSAGSAGSGQHVRLALIRSLLWAHSVTAPSRLRQLVAACGSGDELNLAVSLAATPGSRFVFEFPDIVRLLLVRGEDLAVADAVRQRLWLSACGGGRSGSGHEMDPEYRYILEQGEALANRYRDDTVLEQFYRGVAQSERRQIEWWKREFREEGELD